MIKNIVFDVGDVLLEYRWRDMLTDHGLTPQEVEAVGKDMFEDELWHILDLETMPVADVIQRYHEKYPNHGDVIEWFITHGEYMHVGRLDVWAQVRRLKEKGYGIYLLSNYSKDLFDKHTKDADFLEDIDGKVVSYEVHITKPDPAIYQCLFNKYHLKPKECIFFDDRKDNVEAAIREGMDAVHVTSKEMLLSLLKQIM